MLKLGNFIFAIDDYPSSIQMGGTSLSAVTKFQGGHKSIQMLGNFLDPITLKGTFMYSGAVTKMNQINDMWFAQQPILLTAPGFSPRYVVITMFHPTYYNDYQIDYNITLEPVDSWNVDAAIYTSPSSSSSSGSNGGGGSPSPSQSSSSSSSTSSGSPQQIYIVKSGDTLWGIANKFYGNGSLYTKIVSANNIKNPSNIQIGERLVIPSPTYSPSTSSSSSASSGGSTGGSTGGGTTNRITTGG